MAILVFQHHPDESPLVLASVLQGYGQQLRTLKLYARDTVPVDLDDVDGIVSMGGPMNVEDAAKHPWMAAEMAYLKRAHEAGVPIVGICLGCQLIAAAMGGQVAAMKEPEVGFAGLRLAFPGTIDPIYGGIPWNTMQMHMHGQEVTQLPPGGTPLAGSAKCKTQAFKVGLTTYAFQYHFECDRPAVQAFSQDSLVTKAGASADAIAAQADQHYDLYRHLGNRLCDNLALLLFPVNKRRPVAVGA